MKKKLLSALLVLAMMLTMIPTAFAVETSDTGYGGEILPGGPTEQGDVLTVTPENAQYTLDGAYGSINGKTIHFSKGSYTDVLVLARPTKYAGSGTNYFKPVSGGFVEQEITDLMNTGVYWYDRTVSNVTFTADEGVVLPGFTSGSGHVYETSDKVNYDYVRDINVSGTVTSYYASCSLEDITFKNLTISGQVELNDYSDSGYTKNAVNQNITFDGCTFTGDKTKMADKEFAALKMKADKKYYSNITVRNCTIKDYYQGIYIQGVNGATIENNYIQNTTHNAIALQSSATNPVMGTVVISENVIDGTKDRAIRFGEFSADYDIAINNNVMTNSGDSDHELIKAESVPAAEKVSLEHNYWSGKELATAVQTFVQPKSVGVIAGTFLADPTVGLASGYTATLENGKYVISALTADDAVAKVGDKYYPTLKDALLSLTNSQMDTVEVELLNDQNVEGFTVDLTNSAVMNLTIVGSGKKLDSNVEIGDQDKQTSMPIIDINMVDGAKLVVDSVVFPNSLIFDDQSANASVTIQNCTFHKCQVGYPKAKEITYDHNTFSFDGDWTKSVYLNHNAYPLWFKAQESQKIVLTNNTVTGYPRGFHINSQKQQGSQEIIVNNNTFKLANCCDDHSNKRVALQLVGKLNGNIEFQNNNVDAYMGVCFYKGIVVTENAKLTIQNNHTTGKLYGSNEWSKWNSDTETEDEKIAAADAFAKEIVEGREDAGNGSVVTEGHTHNYENGVCTICGQNATTTGGGSVSTYTLTFEVNGGSELKKLTRAYGTTIDLSDYIPTRAGYTFAGWYSDKELTEKVTSIKLNSNTTVYAKWTLNAGGTVAGFTDVKIEDWFAEEVQYVVDKGLMSGTSSTTFAPNGTTTRGMIVAILYRMEKEPTAPASVFTDVKAGAYYEKAIDWAAANEIVKGVSETTFAPDQAITREQLAAILYRYAQFKGYNVSKMNKLDSYADAAQVSPYAVPAMQWANAENLITGKSATILDPKGDATRAEVSSILMRFCENIAK